MRVRLSEAEAQLVDLQAKLELQQRAVRQLQTDVDKIIEVERQLDAMTQDAGIMEGRYKEARSRWEELQSTKRLEPVADQVEYRRIEPPFAPEEAAGPPRRIYLGAVTAFSVGGGGALAFGLNMLMPAFFSRRSLARVAELPVLGSVSLITSTGQRARVRADQLAWLLVVLALAVVFVAAFIVVTPASDLLRSMIGAGT
jgi:hypothetical protein